MHHEHPETEVQIIGRYLAEHTPQLRDPVLAPIIMGQPTALLAMGFMFGLLFQAQAPMTAEGILAQAPDHLREQDDAINGLINTLNDWRVQRRQAAAGD